ncbi:MAG: YIP1 family protein [Candidatus Aminicenantaceae bacterium]
MSFFQRLQGVFFNPQFTFKGISEQPIWLDTLILLLIFIILFSYITSPYARSDSLKFMENNEVRLQERMGEERYNQRIESIKNPSNVTLIIQFFIFAPLGFLISILISSLFIFALGRLSSTEGRFIQVFSALLHANFIDKILGNGVRLILALTRKSLAEITTSFALFYPHLEVGSPAYTILSQIDFFQLWLFGILSYGLSCIFKIELKKALLISYGFWLLKSIFNIAIGLLIFQAIR